MYYEIWGKYAADVWHVAVVFRGTVPSNISHWCANLRAVASPFCDPASDQYLAIAALTQNLMSEIYDMLGPQTFSIMVGHSLGGGLAELATNTSYFTTAVTFNSSPVQGRDISTLIHSSTKVTGKARQAARIKIENLTKCGFDLTNPVRSVKRTSIQVFESGDVLEPLRLLNSSTASAPNNLSPVIYKTNVLRGGPLDNHSMKALACALLQ